MTSNWWGQSWGRTCEPVRLTKLGTCLTHPTSLPYTRTRIVAGQKLVGYTTPLPGNPPRLLYREARSLQRLPLPTIGVKKEGGCLPARLPLNAFTAIQAVGMPERFVQLSPFAYTRPCHGQNRTTLLTGTTTLSQV